MSLFLSHILLACKNWAKKSYANLIPAWGGGAWPLGGASESCLHLLLYPSDTSDSWTNELWAGSLLARSTWGPIVLRGVYPREVSAMVLLGRVFYVRPLCFSSSLGTVKCKHALLRRSGLSRTTMALILSAHISPLLPVPPFISLRVDTSRRWMCFS